jgi:hypothetical protein
MLNRHVVIASEAKQSRGERRKTGLLRRLRLLAMTSKMVAIEVKIIVL